MYKIYRKFWSDKELDDLYNLIVSNKWHIQGTVGANDIKDRNDIQDKDYYSKKNRARIAQAQTLRPKNIPVHFKDKLLKVMNSDFTVEGDSYYFDEEWAINRYLGTQGGKFDWHEDVLDFFIYEKGSTAEQHFIRNTRPQRKLSVSVAMNNKSDYNGGNLVIGEEFKNSKREPVDLDRGDMLIFTSNTYHGVEPVTEGTRYALIIWALSYNEMNEWNKYYRILEDNTETTL